MDSLTTIRLAAGLSALAATIFGLRSWRQPYGRMLVGLGALVLAAVLLQFITPNVSDSFSTGAGVLLFCGALAFLIWQARSFAQMQASQLSGQDSRRLSRRAALLLFLGDGLAAAMLVSWLGHWKLVILSATVLYLTTVMLFVRRSAPGK